MSEWYPRGRAGSTRPRVLCGTRTSSLVLLRTPGQWVVCGCAWTMTVVETWMRWKCGRGGGVGGVDNMLSWATPGTPCDRQLPRTRENLCMCLGTLGRGAPPSPSQVTNAPPPVPTPCTHTHTHPYTLSCTHSLHPLHPHPSTQPSTASQMLRPAASGGPPLRAAAEVLTEPPLASTIAALDHQRKNATHPIPAIGFVQTQGDNPMIVLQSGRIMMSRVSGCQPGETLRSGFQYGHKTCRNSI